ncbi:hypothetical protein EYF80_026973 [Liparis tanakae]|uniref:Uncharacterized protein n=1 Tax=Liparis tanakae TaxID=230148 RepID=A0A4Z2HA23_9TELE|nr:hypothetical protein EYF80_026973 [Liparis tanakae]
MVMSGSLQKPIVCFECFEGGDRQEGVQDHSPGVIEQQQQCQTPAVGLQGTRRHVTSPFPDPYREQTINKSNSQLTARAATGHSCGDILYARWRCESGHGFVLDTTLRL